MTSTITVALAGNPNCGKTTIFNNLTGARQHVGNYPGVTVEKKEGTCTRGDVEFEIVDLPGTYSLTAYSVEEVVARDFITDDKPDVVVHIVDASNLERNLYLAVQIMELGAPLVLAFNMSDVTQARGEQFDLPQLARLFGAPIVETVGHKNKGMTALLDAVVAVAEGTTEHDTRIHVAYGKEIEEELDNIQRLIESEAPLGGKYDARWLAVKLLEHDEDMHDRVTSPNITTQVEKSTAHLERILGEHPETAIPGRRYGFISGACQETVRSTVELRHTTSDRIDAVLTNRILGLPIFLAMMYLVFYLTFTVGGPPMDWIEAGFGWLSNIISGMWPEGSESALRSLLVDGIIGGVGGVVIFLPNIMMLFLAIAFLEDSGYMARAAFIMDRLMHKIGLHGKSFIPMLTGFGCSVPAIMATRTLENERDRITTMLVVPLMSCGARLPIYALLIPAFFPSAWHAPMLWIIYVTGIALAILSAKLLRATLLKGPSVPFVMELPPYRIPTAKGIFIHMWDRSWLYLKKAGTIILGVSILLWVMTSYPKKAVFDHDYQALTARAETTHQNATDALPPGAVELAARIDEALSTSNATAAAKLLEASDPQLYTTSLSYFNGPQTEYNEEMERLAQSQQSEELSYSIAGRIGKGIEPLLRPMGFDWRIGTALIGAFAAKEVFVSQMGIVYSVGEADEESGALREQLQKNYNPLIAFCIMIFCLISAPCVATIAVTRRESNSWKWAMLQLGGLTALAWLVTVIIYQVGSLLGFGIA